MKKKKICTLALLSVLSYPLASCGGGESLPLPTISSGQIEDAEKFVLSIADKNIAQYTKAVNSEDFIGVSLEMNTVNEIKLYDLENKLLQQQALSSNLNLLANLDAKALNGTSTSDRTTYYYETFDSINSQNTTIQNYYNNTDGLKVVVNNQLDEGASKGPQEGGIVLPYKELFSQVKLILNDANATSIEKIAALMGKLQEVIPPGSSAESYAASNEGTSESIQNFLVYVYGYLIGQGEHTEEQKNRVVSDFVSLFEKMMGTPSGSLAQLKTTARTEILKLVSNLAYINIFKCLEINALESSISFNGDTFKKELSTVLVYSKKELKKIFKEMGLIINPSVEISDKDLTTQIDLMIETIVTFADALTSLKLTLVNKNNYTVGIVYESVAKSPYYDPNSSEMKQTGYTLSKSLTEFTFELNEGIESIPSYSPSAE